MRLVGVPLSADLVGRFYEGYSNGVLWPLFHYLLDQIPLQVADWDGYVEANEAFADVVAAHYRPDDMIWVHDYQLFLLPALLRERLPGARIGFFLHIPFPSEELFRTLPTRDRLLQGMLGADLVGFHTPAYLRHFATSLTDILGLTVDIDRVQLPEPGGAARACSRWAWTRRRSRRSRPIPRSRARSRRSAATGACGS